LTCQDLAHHVQFVLPPELTRDSCEASPTERLPQIWSPDEQLQLLGEMLHITAPSMKSVNAVANELAGSASPIDQVGLCIRPGLEQHETEGIGLRRQREKVNPGEEAAFLLIGQGPESRHSLPRPELWPEGSEVRHFRTGKDDAKLMPAAPGALRCEEKIYRSFLGALVREMSDDNFTVGKTPRGTNGFTIAAGAFRRLYAEAL
jgi:hypothetical protein